MGGLFVMLGWAGLGIGILLVAASMIVLLVAFGTSEPSQKANRFNLAGKMCLAGILLFAVGFGSCVVSFNFKW